MVFGERLRSWRSSMKRWRRGVMATLVEHRGRNTTTGCPKCAPASDHAQVGKVEKEDSRQGPKEGAGEERVEGGSRKNTKGRAPSVGGHRAAVSFNDRTQQRGRL